MNLVKKNKGGKINVSDRYEEIEPPKGFHWVEDRGRYFLTDESNADHEGAVDKAKFKLVSH